jgi:hypothetical protein
MIRRFLNILQGMTFSGGKITKKGDASVPHTVRPYITSGGLPYPFDD